MKYKVMKMMMILMISAVCFDSPSTKVSANNVKSSNRVEVIVEKENTNKNLAVKKGKKTINYKNGSNKILWSVTVKGTFVYGNGTVMCTESEVSVYSNDSHWEVSNLYSTKTENTAIASATGTRYLSGIEMQMINREVHLSCSSTGELS